MNEQQLTQDIKSAVKAALHEDIGDGDITALLVPAGNHAKAKVISRENAIICGQAWVNEVFAQLDLSVEVEWLVKDGDRVSENQTLFTLSGPARSLLTGERTALNFLQLLSGTATICRQYADLVEGTSVKLLDTRKTIPGLRTAQKYAVTCGGCYNHRIGLFDAFLIKENHIAACGGIAEAISAARKIAPGKPVEVEVEDMEQFDEALEGGADIIMLDNFSVADTVRAVALNRDGTKLEASGGISIENLQQNAATGVDFISLGKLTKDCKALDLSMRLIEH
ncbi:MAG: nicotinate-nucleotide pyrophosphorylase (carboxylating) [Paracoccaceae bacterium]